VTDGHRVPTQLPAGSRIATFLENGTARPLALATADFDEDGVPDVVCSYATEEGGFLTFHRGNVDAIYQNAPEAMARRAAGKFLEAPFLPDARAFEVLETPDFIAAGDFDADGHWDLVAAKRGGETLMLHRGDGQGGFGDAQTIALSGLVTAMTAGEINRRDGLTDLVVGVEGLDSASVLIFEGPGGALLSPPESIVLPEPAIDFALAPLDDPGYMDLAIAMAQGVVIVHGRDRRVSHSQENRETVAAPVVDRFAMPFTIAAMAAGDFDGDRKVDLAFLDESGSLHIAAEDGLAEVAVGNGRPPEQAPREVKALTSRAAKGPRDVRLHSVRVSSLPGDDLLLVHHSGRRIHLRLPQEVMDGRLPNWVPFEVEGEPVAILSMRLNADAQSDMVVLSEGPASLSTVGTSSFTTFNVTNTNAFGAGSFLQAIVEANTTPGGDVIEFHIPGAGPHSIQDTIGLPSITGTVIIDATTNPGFAGTPVVEIDFSVSPASSGIRVVAGSTTIRGLVLNGSSGRGILLDPGDNAIIEGNFIGTDLAGMVPVANGTGILLDSTIAAIIGGTTAGARNVISGNAGNGIGILADASLTLVQGNFIGTDALGTGAVGNAAAGIEILGSDNTIGGTTPAARNLISANAFWGIAIRSAGTPGRNDIKGNYIGVDASGTSVLGSNLYGILIENSSDNLIGGTTAAARNIISGGLLVGVEISSGSSSNDVFANYIGTTAAGTAALGNGACGVFIDQAPNNRIGGPGALANVISGNGRGICIWSAASTGNLVEVNFIGTDPTGMLALGNRDSGIEILNANGNMIGVKIGQANVISGNAGHGISIENSISTALQGNVIGLVADGSAALPNAAYGVFVQNGSSNIIGGAASAEGNIISGNALGGIGLATTTLNEVQNNLIGLSPDGTVPRPNAWSGVWVSEGSANLIGGPSPGLGNTISGNTLDGVLIINSDSNSVQSNTIGMDPSRGIALGNGGSGVRLVNDASSNSIGGGLATTNLIAFNGVDGVQVESGVSNAIRANSMFANGGLGIDLQADGVTANDSQDPDVGPNALQNFPLLSAVTTTGGTVTFELALNSTPSSMFSIDLYHDFICDSFGHGQGHIYIGSAGLPTDAAGNGSFASTTFSTIADGEFLSATITDSMGNTSEFSTCSAAVGVAPLALEGVLWDLAGGPRIMWEESPGADFYNIYVGGLSNLAHLADKQPDSCRQTAVESTTFFDIPVTQTPPPGQILWWMIRPEGSYGEGDASDGSSGPREHDSIGLCGDSCAHDKGVTGVALESACDPCVSMICAADPFCCGTSWDGACVQEVRTVCGSLTTAESQGTCQHTLCTSGEALQPKCDSPPVSPSCVEEICNQDSFCCTNSWDNLCVDQVTTVCNKGCL
jgi:hypothetical protein